MLLFYEHKMQAMPTFLTKNKISNPGKTSWIKQRKASTLQQVLEKKTTVVALSAGTLGAAWMAEHRPGLDHVLLISPFFGVYGWPVSALDIATAFLVHFPSFYFWKKNPQYNGPYVYPGYGSRCLAKTLELSRNVRSFQGTLQVRQLDILFSGADHVVNGELTQQVAHQWAAQNPGKVFLHEFPASLNIAHDCVDPNTYNSKTEWSYPVILKILGYTE